MPGGIFLAGATGGRRTLPVLLLAASLTGACAERPPQQAAQRVAPPLAPPVAVLPRPSNQPVSVEEQAGYAFGVQAAQLMRPLRTHIEQADLYAGLDDAFDGRPPRLDAVSRELSLQVVASELAVERRQDDGQAGAAASEQDRHFSYTLGGVVGAAAAGAHGHLSSRFIREGFFDAFNGVALKLDAARRAAALEQVGSDVDREHLALLQQLSARNRADGRAFLDTLSHTPGVTTTASGLEYRSIVAGSGPFVQAGDVVTVGYRVRRIDGSPVAGSGRERPVTLPVEHLIRGLREGLPYMRVGSRFCFYIRPELAYGELGDGGRVLPNDTLIYVIEVLAVLRPGAPVPQPQAPDGLAGPNAT